MSVEPRCVCSHPLYQHDDDGNLCGVDGCGACHAPDCGCQEFDHSIDETVLA